MSTNKTNQATPPGQQMDLNSKRMNTGICLLGNRPNLPEDLNSKPSPHHGPQKESGCKNPSNLGQMISPLPKNDSRKQVKTFNFVTARELERNTSDMKAQVFANP